MTTGCARPTRRKAAATLPAKAASSVGPVGHDRDVGAARGLAHLILDHRRMLAEDVSEHVGMHGRAVGIRERVVEAALRIADASKRRTARARPGDDRDFVGDLEPDQREGGVVEVGDEDALTRLTRRHGPPVAVDDLDQAQVVGQVDAVGARVRRTRLRTCRSR